MKIIDRLKSDKGLMGRTHALSALAVFLMLTAFFTNFVFDRILQTNNLLIYFSGMLVCIGIAMWPDFDNTKSTAISTFGVVGTAISKGMRAIAVFIYSLVHSRHDDPTPNPHRSFWHTLASAFLLGILILITTSLPFVVTIPVIDKPVKIGFIFAVLWVYASFKLALAGLLGDYLKKNKSFVYSVFTEIVVLLFSISVLLLAPGDLDYKWLAYSAILGYSIHILGDTMTKAGTPLFWPIKHNGKRWYDYRIFGFKAGGSVEKIIVIPSLVIISVLSVLKIFYTYIGG